MASDMTLGPRARRGIARWDAGVLVAANAVVVVGLWWRQGGIREVHDAAGLMTSLGRVTGLVGAYLALVQLLLLARVPPLDTLAFDRVGAWHRVNGIAVLALLVAHTGLITAGYALADGMSLAREAGDLLTRYSGVLLATIGLGLLVAVVVTSVAIVRRRLSRRAWQLVHAGSYAAIALAFSHQLATGHEFDDPVARAYWWALYAAVVVALVAFRVVLPVARSLRHRLRVERVVQEAPGVVSLEIGGERLDRLGALAGQHLRWRFLAPGHWWRAYPLSLSAAPDGRRLRVTAKGSALASLPAGTRVIAEGPSGGLTSAARRRPRAALIAGGVGIAPMRALLEEMPGEIAVVYRAAAADDVLFGDELEALARRRGAELHYVLGDHEVDRLSAERLRALVPDIADRDVYLCGPAAMTRAARASLREAGVPRRQIVSEGIGW